MWRDKYRVHPAANVFPMMEGEELAALVEDIKGNGLKTPITVDKDGVLLDGRNRLEALDLAGMELRPGQTQIYSGTDPVGFIISANIRRRHLSKQQQAELIWAAVRTAEPEAAKPRQVGEVSGKGGRGKVNKVKARAVEECKKLDISKRTAERARPKAEGEQPSKRKRHRRTNAERERDYLLGGYRNHMLGISESAFTDEALNLLTKEQTADLAEYVDGAMAKLAALRQQLRQRLEREAA